jgi:hypothetical protein
VRFDFTEKHELSAASLWILGSANTSTAGKCMKVHTVLQPGEAAAGIVYYIEVVERLANDAPAKIAALIAHGIGHFLGLGDTAPDGTSAMTSSYDLGGKCADVTARDVTAADAAAAGRCVRSHHQKFRGR